MDSDSSPSAAPPAAAEAGRYTYSPRLRWQPEVEEYFAAAYGCDHFARISEALAHPSCYSCIRVNTLKSSTDAVMHKLMDLISKNELSAVINGLEVVELNGGEQQHERGSLVHKCPYAGLENVLFVQGSGPHVLHYGSQPDQAVKEVVVSRKCAESVLRGAQVYVPGVLACSSHVEKGDKVAVSVAIEQPVKEDGWAVGITRGTVLQGLQSDAHYEERKGLYIGQGTAAMSRSAIFRVPHGIAVEMTERVYKLPSFNDVLEGEIFLQNLPSVVTARVLDDNLNAKRYISKAELRKNLRRMKNGPGRNNCSGGRVEKSKGFCPNSFDRVLLDAPCSALGLRPRLFAGEETLESLKNHAQYQRRMFDQAVKLVRPGGVIVYSTCTINPGENEALVRYALDTYKYLSLVPQFPKVGGPGIVGSCELFNKSYTEEWLREDEAELVQRFDPSSSVDTIGFFIAKFNVGEKDE